LECWFKKNKNTDLVDKSVYVIEKKTQKTKKTQYVDADEHPVQSRIFRNSGVVSFGQDGYILSGLIPH